MCLHVFVDASQDAYGAVVYEKVEYQNETSSIRLVASKTKVAPLQSLSIPRLELMGAVLGNKLAQTIVNVLTISKDAVTFSTDSTSVLWWIRGHNRKFKPFVANRVGEIQISTSPDQWRYVPTNINPADYLTRGVKLSELMKLKIWWEGPDYIHKDKEFWPKKGLQNTPVCVVEEVKKKYVGITELREPQLSTCVTLVNSKDESVWRLQPQNFSDWKRLTRLYAWVMRFVNNCYTVKSNKLIEVELTAEEIVDAEHHIIRTMQKEVFFEEYLALLKGRKLSAQSKLLGLSPRLDEDKIMRSDGRLKYAEFLPYDVRYPIILPRKNWVTKLIVKLHHELGNHNSGTNQTLSLLSLKYWIIAAREEIIEWERLCAACRRRKAKNAQQIMAPLPANRLVTSLTAFTRTAVDFGGPFITIQGRGR